MFHSGLDEILVGNELVEAHFVVVEGTTLTLNLAGSTVVARRLESEMSTIRRPSTIACMLLLLDATWCIWRFVKKPKTKRGTMISTLLTRTVEGLVFTNFDLCLVGQQPGGRDPFAPFHSRSKIMSYHFSFTISPSYSASPLRLVLPTSKTLPFQSEIRAPSIKNTKGALGRKDIRVCVTH